MGKEVYFHQMKAHLQRVYACGMWIFLLSLAVIITMQSASYSDASNILHARYGCL